MERVTAIEPINGKQPGDTFEVSEREADQLEAKGLVKRAAAPLNKMAPESENKGNPSAADGEGQSSSASPAARASRKTTAKPSAAGVKPAKKATKKVARTAK